MKEACTGVNVAILVGAFPRKQGMERKDLLSRNAAIFVEQGKALNEYADRDVRSILSALDRGAFYSSCGPEIYDFYVEDGVAVVETSPCTEITFRTGQYPGPRLHAPDASLTHHSFRLPPDLRYVRVTMKDAQGRRAWSNPIFLQ